MSRRTNVLIIVENLPVPFDRRVWMEATTLQDAGYGVYVICPKGKGFSADYEVIDGIHIYRHPLPEEGRGALSYLKEYYYALRWEFRLAKQIWRDSGGFDIVHICNPPDLLFAVALRYKLTRGAKVIFDHHDLSPELYEAKYGKKGLFHWILLLLERITFAVADIVISTNQSYRVIALERGKKDPDKVVVVRSAPDLNRFKRREPSRDYRQGARFLVGYVGVMGEQEGIDLLLRAISIIVHEHNRQDIRFMLIGTGPVLDDMKVLVRQLGVDSYVEFTGRVSDEELLERLSACDIGVNPDPKNPFNDKSTMNKVLEYMALGLPIVQFDVIEGRQSAGEASMYAVPNDESDFAARIIELLDTPDRRRTMGLIGRRRMEEQLQWDKQAPELLKAYAALRGE